MIKLNEVFSFKAIATLILAVFFLLRYDSLWLMFLVSAIRSIGIGIQTSAVGAVLPLIVPEDKLTKVNATDGSIQSLVMLVSPMASGALLSAAPIEIIFFIVTAAAVVIMTLFVHFLFMPKPCRSRLRVILMMHWWE